MSEIILFLVGLGALQVIPNLIPHPAGREGENIFLDEAFLIPMLLILRAYETVLIFAAVVFLTHVFQNKPVNKALFNTGQIALATGVAALTGAFIAGIVGAVIGALLYAITSALAVGLLISYLQKRPLSEWLKNDLAFRLIMLFSSLTLGAAMNTAIMGYPEVFPFVAMSVVGLQLGYQRLRAVPSQVLQPLYAEN